MLAHSNPDRRTKGLVERSAAFIFSPVTALGIGLRTGLGALAVLALLLSCISFSRAPWALTSGVPGGHSRILDYFYVALDPTALYLATGYVTFLVFCWPKAIRPAEWRQNISSLRKVPI